MSSLKDLSTGAWTVDPTHSSIGFVARHLVVTKVRGRFSEFSADVTVGERFEDSTLNAAVAMASVDTGNADRDAHLVSGDFFDAESHPEMTFRSTKVAEDALYGDLTIRGITRPVEFELDFNGMATDPWGNTKAAFEAETEVSRKDWGLSWNVPLEGGGVLVGDKVKIVLDVQLLKAA